jgi:hypothetical protein
MSVNLIYAIDQRKVAHKGKYFGTIDFEVNVAPNKIIFNRMGKSVRIGSLIIAGKTYRMTLEQLENLVIDCAHAYPVVVFGDAWDFNSNEIDRLIETLKAAKHVFFQRYRLRV